MDRAGAILETVGQPVDYFMRMVLAPDEKQVAYRSRSGSNMDIWVRDLVRSLATRFTSEEMAALEDGLRQIMQLG